MTWILMLNTAASIVSFFIYFKKSRDEAIYHALVIFFIPLFGLLYFICISLLKIFNYDSREVLYSYEKYINSEVKPSYISKIDISKEVNIVPIEDALILNDNKVKRGLVIDILKDDPSNYISILKKALENSDSETSHYAAAALTELKRSFAMAMEKASIQFENNKYDIDVVINYVEILEKYIKSSLLDEKSLLKYKTQYSKVLSLLLELHVKDEKYFIDKISCDIDLGNFTQAKEYCIKFYVNHKNTENTYLMFMKLFYSTGDFKNLQGMLSALKSTSIKLTPEALESVRFWSGGE